MVPYGGGTTNSVSDGQPQPGRNWSLLLALYCSMTSFRHIAYRTTRTCFSTQYKLDSSCKECTSFGKCIQRGRSVVISSRSGVGAAGQEGTSKCAAELHCGLFWDVLGCFGMFWPLLLDARSDHYISTATMGSSAIV